MKIKNLSLRGTKTAWSAFQVSSIGFNNTHLTDIRKAENKREDKGF